MNGHRPEYVHYQGDLIKNSQDSTLENRLVLLKSKAYSHASITVVNLCNWMMSYSSKSEAFRECSHYVIPNSVNISVFKRRDKRLVRELLQIPNDKPVVLFCSQSVRNERKGFDLLLDALFHLKIDCTFLVVGAGASCPQSISSKTMCFGSIHDELLLSMLYSASDLFILPSREDNLPNTMVEALCCGTPVVSFSNGGMKDIITNYKNGIIVEQQSGKFLADAIMTALNCNFSSQQIEASAHRLFNPIIQAEQYNQLYVSLFTNSR